MTLEDVMNDYLAFIKHEQGMARSTCNCYASWIHHLHRWLVESGYPSPPLDCFNTVVLRRYLYYLTGERHHRPRTVRGAFYPLKGLAKFLLANGLATEDPTATIQMPKKDAAQRLTLSDGEVRALLDACEKQRNPKQTALARAIFHLLTYSGLRRQELLDLRVADVDTQEKSVLVRMGKGGKSRTVYVPDACIHAVQEWLAFRPKDCQHDYLLAFDRKRRLHGIGLMTLFDAVTAAAGMRDAPNAKPHSLRHWRATDLLKSGADLRSIQAFLGHSTLQVTALYLHTDEERCRNLANITSLPAKAKPQPDNVIDLRQRQAEQQKRLHRIARA